MEYFYATEFAGPKRIPNRWFFRRKMPHIS
jgi:hypothetical protein